MHQWRLMYRTGACCFRGVNKLADTSMPNVVQPSDVLGLFRGQGTPHLMEDLHTTLCNLSGFIHHDDDDGMTFQCVSVAIIGAFLNSKIRGCSEIGLGRIRTRAAHMLVHLSLSLLMWQT